MSNFSGSNSKEKGTSPVSRRVDTEGDLRDALHTVEWDMVIADDSMPCLNALQASTS